MHNSTWLPALNTVSPVHTWVDDGDWMLLSWLRASRCSSLSVFCKSPTNQSERHLANMKMADACGAPRRTDIASHVTVCQWDAGRSALWGWCVCVCVCVFDCRRRMLVVELTLSRGQCSYSLDSSHKDRCCSLLGRRTDTLRQLNWCACQATDHGFELSYSIRIHTRYLSLSLFSYFKCDVVCNNCTAKGKCHL